MKNDKKTYASPRVTTHGTVEELTQHGGGHNVDVPYGTPITSTSTIADITSGP